MSAAGERYLYKDSSQQLQGPFDLEEMRAWFAAGYLPEDLNVRLESETEFTTIKDRASSGKPFAFTTAVSSAETSSEPQNKKAKSTIQTSSEKENVDGEEEDDEPALELTDLDRKWLYKDKSGVVRGPFVGAQVRDWFVAGYFPPDTQFREENNDEFVALQELQTDPTFFLQDSIIQWFYVDKQGREQGPFWNDEMTEWWGDGMFPPDLRVRKKGEREFIPVIKRPNCEFARRPPGSGIAGALPPWLANNPAAAIAAVGANMMMPPVPTPSASASTHSAGDSSPSSAPLSSDAGAASASSTDASDSTASSTTAAPGPSSTSPSVSNSNAPFQPLALPVGAGSMMMPPPIGPNGLPLPPPPHPHPYPHPPPPHMLAYPYGGPAAGAPMPMPYPYPHPHPHPPPPYPGHQFRPPNQHQAPQPPTLWLYQDSSLREVGPLPSETIKKMFDSNQLSFQSKVRKTTEMVFSSLGGRMNEIQHLVQLQANQQAQRQAHMHTPQGRMEQMLNRIDNSAASSSSESYGSGYAGSSAAAAAYMQQQADYNSFAASSLRGKVTTANLNPSKSKPAEFSGMFDFNSWQEQQQNRKRKGGS